MNGEAILRSICRSVGNVQLRSLAALDLVQHLDNPRHSLLTRRGQYSIVKGFLGYWISRDAMKPMTLPVPPRSEITFVPHLYSAEQVRKLLIVATKTRGSTSISPETLRMFLLMLYATGAASGEILELRRCDLSPTCTHIAFHRNRERRIPLCLDLQQELRQYISSGTPAPTVTRLLFCSENGKRLDRCYLSQRFRRVQKLAGIERRDSSLQPPRMQDFRASFAVRRLASWLKRGSDLNRLLPALSTYMGFSTLSAADKFLPMVPERFRTDLKKLSPLKGKHWRNKLSLMKMLDDL